VFVLGSNMIHHFNRDDRDRHIAVEDNGQAIGKPEFFEGQVKWKHCCNICNREGNSQR
jgi:hypothetical protein